MAPILSYIQFIYTIMVGQVTQCYNKSAKLMVSSWWLFQVNVAFSEVVRLVFWLWLLHSPLVLEIYQCSLNNDVCLHFYWRILLHTQPWFFIQHWKQLFHEIQRSELSKRLKKLLKTFEFQLEKDMVGGKD